MHLPVLLQHERALPGEELETVPACLRDQLAQPARRQVADAGSRMHADAEQHLVLDDVAHAGEYLLVQQRIADLCGGRGLEPAAGQGRVPAIAHHVRAPVVHLVQRLLDEHHRARIDVELVVVEAQRCPGAAGLRWPTSQLPNIIRWMRRLKSSHCSRKCLPQLCTMQPVNRPAASRSSTIDGPSGMTPSARPGSGSVR